MTDPIAAKAEALWAKRPELRPHCLRYDQTPASGLGWWISEYRILHHHAHMLIEAACVRWLTKQHDIAVRRRKDGEAWIIDKTTIHTTIKTGATLTEALIAACMEAKP